MNDLIKKFNQYLLKGQFKLVFNKNHDCKYLMTDMINNTTNVSLSNYLREAIDSLKEERYDFIYVAEMDIITLAHKRDMTHDFYLKCNMSAFEWKLTALINKDWRHPINNKFYCYRV